MKTKFISLLAILLGLIIIMFPIFGVIGVSSLIGLSVLLVSIYLLVVGVSIIDYNTSGAIIDLLLGLVLLLLSIFLIFNPSVLGFLTVISLSYGRNNADYCWTGFTYKQPQQQVWILHRNCRNNTRRVIHNYRNLR